LPVGTFFDLELDRQQLTDGNQLGVHARGVDTAHDILDGGDALGDQVEGFLCMVRMPSLTAIALSSWWVARATTRSRMASVKTSSSYTPTRPLYPVSAHSSQPFPLVQSGVRFE
jgi:hypothetical protein